MSDRKRSPQFTGPPLFEALAFLASPGLATRAGRARLAGCALGPGCLPWQGKEGDQRGAVCCGMLVRFSALWRPRDPGNVLMHADRRRHQLAEAIAADANTVILRPLSEHSRHGGTC